MSQSVREYYDANVDLEASRLDLPLCRIEFRSTLRLIGRYFPRSGRVCDIGSGPGRYSIELARRGYRVTLYDLSEGLLSRARSVFAEHQLHAERFICADAADLHELESGGYDAALLLGPMYHVIDSIQRAQTLRGLTRVLRPGGIAIVAYLNSWGILRTGVADFPARYRDAQFMRSMLGELTFERELAGFTESFWATPELALAELRRAGFCVLTYAGAEGFVGGMRPLVERLASEDPDAYQNLVEVAVETSELPQYRDACDHLHFVVRNGVV
jgi:S-adenosylmethionine-dependent methyltransferase